MNTRIYLLIGLVLLLTLSNSSIYAGNVYTEKNKTILISSNHPQFTIKLKSNPSTGYKWSLRQYNSSLIKLVKHQYVQPTSKLIGAPGYEIWTFRVQPHAATGKQAKIRLVYARPWESDANTKTVVFNLSIKQ